MSRLPAVRVNHSTRRDSRFSKYVRSPAIQAAGESFIARNPMAAAYIAKGETGAHVLLRGLVLFSDPARIHEQRAVLGLPASASRAEVLRAFAGHVGLDADGLKDALESVRDSVAADALFDRMEASEADAARAKGARVGAGGKDAIREQPRKPTDEDVRRADVEAAIAKHGGVNAGLGRKRGDLYGPSNPLQTDIAMAMWSHGALDKQIDISAPGATAWAKEGTQADRTKALLDTMDARELTDAADTVDAYLFGSDDDTDSDTNTNDPEVTSHDR